MSLFYLPHLYLLFQNKMFHHSFKIKNSLPLLEWKKNDKKKKSQFYHFNLASWSHKRKGREENLRCNIKPSALVDRALMNVTSITQWEIGENWSLSIWSTFFLSLAEPVSIRLHCLAPLQMHQCALQYPCLLFPNAATKVSWRLLAAHINKAWL